MFNEKNIAHEIHLTTHGKGRSFCINNYLCKIPASRTIITSQKKKIYANSPLVEKIPSLILRKK